MDTQKNSKGWTDEELEASVDAYLKMLALEQSGKTFKKNEENRRLREGILSQRSASSIEYRMQNISAVLEQLQQPRISGYMPAKNIGAGVIERIRAVLAIKQGLNPDDCVATANDETLEQRASNLQRHLLKTEPHGISNPQQLTTTSTSYVRDPHVRAWVRQQSKGVCEGCGLPAPFEMEDGTPFLEVHHVKHLAHNGSDRISNAVALCPNCHQRCHRSADREAFTLALYRKVTRLVAE